MRKRDRRAFGGYMRGVADMMGLRDWEFDIHFDADPDDVPYEDDEGTLRTLAYINPTPGRKHAAVHVSPDMREWDAEKIRMIVCHELVHCHLAALQNLVENDLNGMCGQPFEELFRRQGRIHLEYGVDGIASAWAESLPLIEWP
jgi:hypothetical protein